LNPREDQEKQPMQDRQGRAFFGSLESLRGVAALLVALYHVSWLNPTRYQGLVLNSYLMVDLFFVLSGFVMCHGYGDRIRNRAQLGDFLVLRIGRLYPLHVMMLFVFVVREAVKFGAVEWLGVSASTATFSDNSARAFGSNLLLIHALGLHDHLTFNGPSWSISTEFYAYICFGLMVLALRNRSKATQLASFLTISVSSLAFLLFIHPQDLNVMYDFGWFRCTMSFFLGAASYTVLTRSDLLRRPAVRRLASYVAIVGLVAGALFLQHKIKGPTDFLLPPLVVVVVVALAASDTGVTRWLQIRPLRYLGKVSYSIYMVHALLSYQMSSILISGFHVQTFHDERAGEIIATSQSVGTLLLVLYIGLVLLVSHMTFTYVEEPFRRKAKAWVLATPLRHPPQSLLLPARG
jgi:peptidoglycan/LPS O-acetylase OafA/YrhL